MAVRVSFGGRRRRPTAWRLPMTIKANMTPDPECWVMGEGIFSFGFFYNPQYHGNLTLEFLCQALEKFVTEGSGANIER